VAHPTHLAEVEGRSRARAQRVGGEGREMDAVKDGGPPGWAMVGELGPAPGLKHLEHCRLAATTFGYIAYRLRKIGQIQHYKTLAIL
jgi:hypothetical protein